MTVTLPYDPNWAALDWAKQHCHGYITNKVKGANWSLGEIEYFFSNEKDGIIFMLRWA